MKSLVQRYISHENQVYPPIVQVLDATLVICSFSIILLYKMHYHYYIIKYLYIPVVEVLLCLAIIVFIIIEYFFIYTL